MKIRVERFGGLAGLVTSKEIEAVNLPSPIINKVHEILRDKLPNLTKTSLPKGAADHFNYRIIIQDGKKNKVIECNQYDIKDDLKDIVKFIEANSKKC